MVDLKGQFENIKTEVYKSFEEIFSSSRYIGGPKVKLFEKELSLYLNVDHVISCANGTDALQIALMALNLSPGDEVIVPSFTYVATAEVIALLGLKPVMVEVDTDTFNSNAELIKDAITSRTKVIVPVHLFGQCSDMEDIMKLATQNNLWVIEDNAQALGAEYTYKDGSVKKAGTIGHIGCTSFFPSKNLGCYGDGGAIFTQDEDLANRIRMIANHGQEKKYHHSLIGVNSRLDALQAAILSIKLKRLNEYSEARQFVAQRYDESLNEISNLRIPYRANNSSHVFHQYTLIIKASLRDLLRKHLSAKGIPSMIYYPIPLYKQKAFENYFVSKHKSTEYLCNSVLSIPMHTEMKSETQSFIIENILDFFGNE